MSENLTPMVHAAQNRCFGCGPANPIGLRMEFLLAPDGGVVCEMTVPALYEGPPGLVHGGMIATMLDEIMSKTVRALGIRAVTRKMEVEYLRPVHSGVVLRLEARLVRKEGRKHWTEAKLLDTEGMVRAQSSGLFVEIPGPIQL